MIELKHVSKTFVDPNGKTVAAVSDLSLKIGTGETLCLIGTSGCGKTTTLKMINRLIVPSHGEIFVDGTDAATIHLIRLRRNMGYVTQASGLFPHLTVAQNILLLCNAAGWDSQKQQQRLEQLMSLVHLPKAEFAHRYPHELSGGQKQRVGVARALALDPDYLLMDEPFGALDPITRDQLQTEFQELAKNLKKTVILVTHDMNEAFRMGERIALMHQGKILQIGTFDEFKNKPANSYVETFLKNHWHGA